MSDESYVRRWMWLVFVLSAYLTFLTHLIEY